MLTCHSLSFFHRTNFLAGVFRIPLIDDITEWSKLIVSLGTVHSIIYSNKVNVMVWENDFTDMDKTTKSNCETDC